jgi:hypothetical protein
LNLNVAAVAFAPTAVAYTFAAAIAAAADARPPW